MLRRGIISQFDLPETENIDHPHAQCKKLVLAMTPVKQRACATDFTDAATIPCFQSPAGTNLSPNIRVLSCGGKRQVPPLG
jgi:hypothetical protein